MTRLRQASDRLGRNFLELFLPSKPNKTGENRTSQKAPKSFAILSLQVSRDMKSVAARPLSRVRKKGVFWKRGLFRKILFLEILESLVRRERTWAIVIRLFYANQSLEVNFRILLGKSARIRKKEGFIRTLLTAMAQVLESREPQSVENKGESE